LEHVYTSRLCVRVGLPLRQKCLQYLQSVTMSNQQQHARVLGGHHALQQRANARCDVQNALAVAARDGPRACCVVFPHTFIKAAA
jgi:hypothetical protein